MQVVKIIFLFNLLTFIGCNNSNEKLVDFQPLKLDGTRDVISQIAAGFNPEKKYDYWACVRSTISYNNSILILYETKKDLYTVDDFKLLNEGFYNTGHHFDWAYYLVTIKDGSIDYITEMDELLSFLGEIDTMEEALLIARINGFGVDFDNPKGGSYRKTKDGFEFLLMDSAPLPKIEFTQYWVKVDKKGNVTSEKGETYCFSMCECYKSGCDY
ncbi:MAG: hypothetical protein GX163_10660 [Bacteroidetes bacterium]|jgi:hypothetical protein|nr:hypothetical protein [Bacteroidota bacterium]